MATKKKPKARATPVARAPVPARAAPKMVVRDGQQVREYPMLADLPEIPFYKKKADGSILTRPKQVRDKDTGEQMIVDEKVLYDPNGELACRNRFGKCLMYEMTLQRREKAPDPLQVTVNDRRYVMRRGVRIVMPWWVIFHFRNNIETKYKQEQSATHPGRKQTVTEFLPAEIITSRPIDPCNDFDDDTAHLPQRPKAEEGEEALGDASGMHTQEPVEPIPGEEQPLQPLAA